MNEVVLLRYSPAAEERERYTVIAKADFSFGEFRIFGVNLCRSGFDGAQFVQIPGRGTAVTRGISIAQNSPIRAEIFSALIERHQKELPDG